VAQKREPSKKQLQFREIAEILSVAVDRDLTSSEWGQFGRMINNFGYPIVKDCAEKFAKANKPVELKSEIMIKYMWGILKQSKVPVERPDSPDIEDILGKDRSI